MLDANMLDDMPEQTEAERQADLDMIEGACWEAMFMEAVCGPLNDDGYRPGRDWDDDSGE